jgi:hypothetical protein
LTRETPIALPYSRVVRHDAIIAPSNPDLSLIKNSLREFLGQIPLSLVD